MKLQMIQIGSVSKLVLNNKIHPPSGGSEASLRVSGEGRALSNSPSLHLAIPSPKSRSSTSTLPKEGAKRGDVSETLVRIESAPIGVKP